MSLLATALFITAKNEGKLIFGQARRARLISLTKPSPETKREEKLYLPPVSNHPHWVQTRRHTSTTLASKWVMPSDIHRGDTTIRYYQVTPGTAYNTDMSETNTNGFIIPQDLNATLTQIGTDVMRKHFPEHLVTATLALHTLSQESVPDPSKIEEIHSVLKHISTSDLQDLIKCTYVYSFLDDLENRNSFQSRFTYTAPLTAILNKLLKEHSIKEAATLIPDLVVYALTPHPVNPDPSDKGTTKRELMLAHGELKQALKSFRSASDEERSNISEKIDAISTNIRSKITLLCTSEYQPKVKITPVEEQVKINRLIQGNEEALISAKKRINRLIQLAFLSRLAEDFIDKPIANSKSLLDTLSLPKNQDKLEQLMAHPLIQTHPDFEQVQQLFVQIKTEIWRQDGDGHKAVTAQTAGAATADGRSRVFSGIKSEDAIVRFEDAALSPDLLKKMEDRLKEVEHIPYWQTYIQNKIALGWGIAKIYSGLVYHRMHEALHGAEEFARSPETAPFSLLREGFRHDREFLGVISLLTEAEKQVGITGFWSKQFELASTRGINLGDTHIRKGEEFHTKLLSDIFTVIFPHEFSSSTPFESLPARQQKEVLRRVLADDMFPNLPLDTVRHLSEESRSLFQNYKSAMEISPWSMLIQSDSGGNTKGDIELSALTLLAVSKLVEHRGKVAILCETKDSMENAITVIQREEFPKDRLVWMCAGSDNQKRMAPFLSAYLNWQFLEAAQNAGYAGFFGVGCSGFRSRYHHPIGETYRTVQPGEQNRVLDPNYLVRSTIEDVAAKIETASQEALLAPQKKAQQDLILKTIAYSTYEARSEALEDIRKLEGVIQQDAGKSLNYFSRPGKKPGGNILDTMRAIELARVQLILNSVDPQLIGLLEGVQRGINTLGEMGIPELTIQNTYKKSAQGQALLKTLVEFHDFLDPELRDPSISHVTREEIAAAYSLLSGTAIPEKPIDPWLRLQRIMRTYQPDNPLFTLLIGSRTAV